MAQRRSRHDEGLRSSGVAGRPLRSLLFLLSMAALPILPGCAGGGNRDAGSRDTKAGAPGTSGNAAAAPDAPVTAPARAPETASAGSGAPAATGGEELKAKDREGERPPNEELRRLEARAAELQAILDVRKREGVASGAAPAGEAPSPDVKALLVMAGRMEGPPLSREAEKLLLGGEQGFAKLHAFFHEADVEHDKIDAITHHPQLIFGMLRLVALYPDEVARFSSYLIKATKEQPGSWLRREYFNFLPVFLNYHPGRYPELRRDLEEDIVYQIQQGGAFLYKVALAMRDMDFQPPADVFYPLLTDPAKRESHSIVIEQLSARKEDGLQLFRRYLSETRDYKSPTVGAVLSAVARLEGREGETVRTLLDHEDSDLRGAALFAYFDEPRDEADLKRVIDLLNSKTVHLNQKRRFLSLLAQKNVDLFDILFAGAETTIQDKDVKEAMRRTAAAVARRKTKGVEAPGKAPGPGTLEPPE